MIQAYLEKQEKSQINNPNYHLKELEKEEQTKPKANPRKGTIKTTEEINSDTPKKTIEKRSMKQRAGF